MDDAAGGGGVAGVHVGLADHAVGADGQDVGDDVFGDAVVAAVEHGSGAGGGGRAQGERLFLQGKTICKNSDFYFFVPSVLRAQNCLCRDSGFGGGAPGVA